MTGHLMQATPMPPRQSPTEFGNAAVQWARCTRRGRTLVFMAMFFVAILGGMKHHAAISSKYHTLSSNYRWRPYHSSIHIPFHPSNTTLQLENGEIDHVPTALMKTTPNFHLLMLPSELDSTDFCKTTLSAMLLNYPPPTAINLDKTFDDDIQKDNATLNLIQDYLTNDKLVHDEDLVLIVDGQHSWFQLPSMVMIKQYESVLEDANARLLNKYGTDRFNQTIVFAAVKRCEGKDVACQYVPPNPVPDDMYGKDADGRVKDTPAKYLSSQMIMGPAKDLRVMYGAAVEKFTAKKSQYQTIQSVLATLFGEQQLRRDAAEKSRGSKLQEFLSVKTKWAVEQRKESTDASQQFEYSMGLDYTHTLFQPFVHCTQDEIISLTHANSTDLSRYRHPNTLTPHLSLPPALSQAKAPFWRSYPYLNNPSPNNEPAYIDKLYFDSDIDTLPDRHTPWTDIPLLQNTYTGAIPAVALKHPTTTRYSAGKHESSTNLIWNTMWYSRYKRALLRNYFRTPQSPSGYHDSLVGGDRAWDMRGGRGGVWTAKEQIWLPWGEVDGVCGTVSQLKEVFQDNKGVWLHEQEDGNEEQRTDEENEYKDKELETRREKRGLYEEDTERQSKVDKERKHQTNVKKNTAAERVLGAAGQWPRDMNTPKEGRKWIA